MTKRSRQIQQASRVMTRRQRARWEREQTLNRRIIIGVGATLAIAILAAVVGVVWERVWKPNRPVATVGSESISRREYLTLREIALVQQLAQAQSQLAQYDQFLQQFSGEQQEAFAQQISTQRQQVDAQIQLIIQELNSLDSAPINYQFLDQLIEDELVLQGAEREGITVSDEEIHAELAEIFAPAPEPAATPEAATGAITSTGELTSTGSMTGSSAISPTATATLTPAQARDAVISGITTYYDNLVMQLGLNVSFNVDQFVEFYQRQQRVELLRERIREKLVSETPKTLQVNAQHILVSVTVPPTATEEMKEEAYAEAKAEADKIYEQLRSGADFAELAREHSDDPGSKEEGGALGWASPDTYVQEFKEAVINQPVGEVGQPVRTQFGWHIIKVLGREERPDESKLEQARNEAFQKWLDEQRAAIGVQRFPEPTPLPTIPPLPTEPASPTVETEQLTPTAPITH